MRKIFFALLFLVAGSAWAGDVSVPDILALSDVPAAIAESLSGDAVTVHAGEHLFVIYGDTAGAADRRLTSVDILFTGDTLTLRAETDGKTTSTAFAVGGKIDGIAHYDLSTLPEGLDASGLIEILNDPQRASCDGAQGDCSAGGWQSTSCTYTGCGGSSVALGCSTSCREGTYSCCGCFDYVAHSVIYTLASCKCCPDRRR